MQLEWHTERRQVKDLIPTERNPRKLNEEGRKRLEAKLNKLGIFEIPTIETNGALLNYNQRTRILLALGRGEEMIDVRVPNRELTDEERKEIILSSNIHEGSWDLEILEADYENFDLAALGMDEDVLKEMEAMMEEEQAPEPEKTPDLPIVARFSERYDAIVIVSRNEIDTNYIAELLELGTEMCYKSKNTGTTHVVTADKFISIWKQSRS